jgi:serine/threonine protein kinase
VLICLSLTFSKCVVKCIRREKEPRSGKALDRNRDGICQRELFMLREALVGTLLEHPNILQMHSFVVGKGHFYFFYEYLPGDDLSEFVTKNGKIQEKQAKTIFLQMLDAVGKCFLMLLIFITPILDS